MRSKNSLNPRSMDFYAIGINKLISHCQRCVDYNGSYVFESSYNNLKFMAQNRNYVCTNIILAASFLLVLPS